MRTHNTEVVRSNPPYVITKSPLMSKATISYNPFSRKKLRTLSLVSATLEIEYTTIFNAVFVTWRLKCDGKMCNFMSGFLVYVARRDVLMVCYFLSCFVLSITKIPVVSSGPGISLKITFNIMAAIFDSAPSTDAALKSDMWIR